MTHEEKLQEAERLYKTANSDQRYVLESLFPELAESEDEKIRKKLISFVENWNKGGILSKYTSNANDIKRILAWLEKQGEKPQGKSALEAIKEEKVDNANKVEPKFKVGDWIIFNGLILRIDEIVDGYYRTTTIGGIPNSYDWDIDNVARLWTIQDARDGDVLATKKGNLFIYDKNRYDNGLAYYYVGLVNKELTIKGPHNMLGHFGELHSVFPATKEQRDTLENAMADAGYIFDFEKKELKKLGQSEVTKMSDQEEIAEIPFGAKDSELQEATYFIPKGFHAEIADDKVVIKKDEKPIEWSYEDEANLNNIIWLCNNCIKGSETTWIPSQATKIKHLIETIKEKGLAQQNPAWSEEDEQIILSIEQVMNCASLLNIVPEKTDKIRTWLKSLKDRCTWKPSSIQMECLHDAINHYYTNGYPASKLKELYEQMSKIYKL